MTSDDGRTNRLIHETSPYLLQHARNPVDWFAWGEEALSQAAAETKPIFLSIGYSACHWCHVMEHESFEDDEVAALLNEHFVSIKVDREERPDLDAIYMNAVVAMTGHGGWPMSVFLTPETRPFFGGTYWPARAKGGMPGFLDILQHVQHAWEHRRGDVDRAAGELVQAVQAMGEPTGDPQALGTNVPGDAARQLLRAADRRYGGFGRAPKFPHAMDLRVLLRAAKRFGYDDARDIVTLTLDKMARGGLYDQLGGGFHRYSTDAFWLVPHFEKMLYDQALLVPAYLEVYQATGREDFGKVVRETLAYVTREMTSPDGGFYSTQDADSEGVEGKFFVWSKQEIESLLDAEEARLVTYCYDVTDAGNWEGANILNRPKPPAEAAAALGIAEVDLEGRLTVAREKLFRARLERIAPARDEKVLVSWNGLMIAAFAQAAAVLDEPALAEQARGAAEFVLSKMRDGSGRLLHTSKDGQAKLAAYLDDYAAFAAGLTELYQATGEVRWLDAAIELAEQMIERFADPAGGFFYTAADHERLIVRQRDMQDGATPSGNSLAATVLAKLARLTTRSDFEDRAIGTLDAMSAQIVQSPLASGQAIIALDFLLGPTQEIVLVGEEEFVAALRRSVHESFTPNKVVATRAANVSDGELPSSLRTLLAGKTTTGDAAAYICEKGVCHAPVTTPEEVRDALRG
ncbi:MAG: thioredoxin domain-containing protein [Planctomycetaceae bacterium]